MNEVVIQINKVAKVQYDKLPRSLWRIGVVKEIITVRENQIRQILVRAQNSYPKRSVNTLYLVEYI